MYYYHWINQGQKKYELINTIMKAASTYSRYLFVIVYLFELFRNQTSRRAVLKGVISTLISLLINAVVKSISYKPRPFKQNHINLIMKSKYDSTIPSKHALLTFTAATSIFLTNKTSGFLLYMIATLTSISRVWVGTHYIVDVLISKVLGVSVSYIVHKIMK